MEKPTNSKKFRKIGPYLLLKEIGKGSYSEVFEATAGGITYAIKKISLQNIKKKQLERIHQELEVLSVIKHPNIVNLIDYKQTAHNLYLVFQHCKFTDLDAYIQDHYGGKVPEEQVRQIMIKLKGAFEEMRKNRVVHRDLKLKNILVTQDFQIKLADFGFAKFQEQQYFTSYVGSPSTMAPQVFQRQKYNQKCDIWSLGIITYQMLFGTNPFFHEKATMNENQIITSYSNTIVFPQEVSLQVQDLIRKTLVKDPKERMNFSELFSHPWLQQKPGCLSEQLRGETLRQQVARSLVKSTKSPIEKQFILQNCQTILSYTLIEFLRNYIENSLTSWLNLAKHLIDLQHSNSRLTFLALAVILQNVDQSIASERQIYLNGDLSLIIPQYMKLREKQSWPMSEYTKRLPGFVTKSRTTINQFLKHQDKVTFSKQEGERPLWSLFLYELKKQIQSEHGGNLRLFLKVKSWEGSNFSINLNSTVLSSEVLKILIRTVSLKLGYNELCKKCSSIFRLAVVGQPSPLELQLSKLRPILLNQSQEE